MKLRFLLFLLLLMPPVMSAASGSPLATTTAREFNVISPDDPTTYLDLVSLGVEVRQDILDARVSTAYTDEVYVVKAYFSDMVGEFIEFQVNKEFGSEQAAIDQVNIWASVIGQFPKELRRGLKAVWLHAGRGVYDDGIFYGKSLEDPPWVGSLGIHVETAEIYNQAGVFFTIAMHELAHVNLDPRYEETPEWLAAQEADGQFISLYAQNYQGEDMAESFVAWLAYRYSWRAGEFSQSAIVEAIMPHRIAYFDRLNLNMSPFAQFEINSGLNGAWYNKATDGQGFLLEVMPERKEIFVAWFTFAPEDLSVCNAMDEELGQNWLVASGPYDGKEANLTIYVAEGGVFNKGQPQAHVRECGSMELSFDNCSKGLVSFETSSGLTGEIPVERIAYDNVGLCKSLTGR